MLSIKNIESTQEKNAVDKHLSLDYSSFLQDIETFSTEKWQKEPEIPTSVLRARWTRKFMLTKRQFECLIFLMISECLLETRQSRTGFGAWSAVKITPLGHKILEKRERGG